jgi:hypothetical protein
MLSCWKPSWTEGLIEDAAPELDLTTSWFTTAQPPKLNKTLAWKRPAQITVKRRGARREQMGVLVQDCGPHSAEQDACRKMTGTNHCEEARDTTSNVSHKRIMSLELHTTSNVSHERITHNSMPLDRASFDGTRAHAFQEQTCV